MDGTHELGSLNVILDLKQSIFELVHPLAHFSSNWTTRASRV